MEYFGKLSYEMFFQNSKDEILRKLRQPRSGYGPIDQRIKALCSEKGISYILINWDAIRIDNEIQKVEEHKHPNAYRLTMHHDNYAVTVKMIIPITENMVALKYLRPMTVGNHIEIKLDENVRCMTIEFKASSRAATDKNHVQFTEDDERRTKESMKGIKNALVERISAFNAAVDAFIDLLHQEYIDLEKSNQISNDKKNEINSRMKNFDD